MKYLLYERIIKKDIYIIIFYYKATYTISYAVLGGYNVSENYLKKNS